MRYVGHNNLKKVRLLRRHISKTYYIIIESFLLCILATLRYSLYLLGRTLLEDKSIQIDILLGYHKALFSEHLHFHFVIYLLR